MRFDPQAGVTSPDSKIECRRHTGRLEQEAVTSNLGVVHDLSAGGMRVHAWRAPRGEFKVYIRGLGLRLSVNAYVAWKKRTGLFRRELGLRFVDVSPQLAEQLTALALLNRQRRVM